MEKLIIKSALAIISVAILFFSVFSFACTDFTGSYEGSLSPSDSPGTMTVIQTLTQDQCLSLTIETKIPTPNGNLTVNKQTYQLDGSSQEFYPRVSAVTTLKDQTLTIIITEQNEITKTVSTDTEIMNLDAQNNLVLDDHKVDAFGNVSQSSSIFVRQ